MNHDPLTNNDFEFLDAYMPSTTTDTRRVQLEIPTACMKSNNGQGGPLPQRLKKADGISFTEHASEVKNALAKLSKDDFTEIAYLIDVEDP